MRKQRGNGLISAIALIVIGVLFIVYKSEIISFAMSLIAIALIVMGVLDIVHKNIVSGIIKIVFGALVAVAGWVFVKLALYVLAAFLLIAGVLELYGFLRYKIQKFNLPVIMHIVQPAIYILVAICLLFNQGGALSWVFVVSGIFFIIDGVVALIGSFDK